MDPSSNALYGGSNSSGKRKSSDRYTRYAIWKASKGNIMSTLWNGNEENTDDCFIEDESNKLHNEALDRAYMEQHHALKNGGAPGGGRPISEPSSTQS
jgi:hypothetical protein